MTAAHRILFLAALALAAQLALAAPAAVVEGIQMPAWVERDGMRIPLTVAMELKPGDRLLTGGDSRVLIRLAEGSIVKLGENGMLLLAELDPRRDGVFQAVMRVAEGAFRFTTEALAKQRRRDVRISVATVTAGIRGTDLWGRSR
ncbi:MAG: FecR domain-containing protein, partial [Burkholderiales bacterium]